MVIPLKKRCNAEYDFLSHPRRAGLERFYTALSILTMALHGCSLLENAGAYSPEQPFYSINALPKTFLIPAESCILRWLGYIGTSLCGKPQSQI